MEYLNLSAVKAMVFTAQRVIGGVVSLVSTILALQPAIAAPSITLKASFDPSISYSPYAALTPAGNGLFYGTTVGGGMYNAGTVYEFDPSGSGSITTKASFLGASPSAALTRAGNGLFYGTTLFGGNNNAGSIYEFDPFGNGSITLKASFDGANGSGPAGELLSAGNGLFYGTTVGGGSYGFGTIYEFDPSGGGLITLKGSFDYATGAVPEAALTPAGNGLFYGTTSRGGSYGVGTIYEFDPSGGGSITLKASFDYATGIFPIESLTPAGNGRFYGSTSDGGYNSDGTIFEFDPSGAGSITLRANFDRTSFSRPSSTLLPTTNSTFYGTTALNGINGYGAIFEFDPLGSGGTGPITLKAIFDGANGYSPIGLTLAGDDLFYGVAVGGGIYDVGAIYKFNSSPSSSVPGPLPLMGAVSAFSWSRRLRRRILQMRSHVHDRPLKGVSCKK